MEEDLGFGEVKGCLTEIGITCEECRYVKACVYDEQEESE